MRVCSAGGEACRARRAGGKWIDGACKQVVQGFVPGRSASDSWNAIPHSGRSGIADEGVQDDCVPPGAQRRIARGTSGSIVSCTRQGCARLPRDLVLRRGLSSAQITTSEVEPVSWIAVRPGRVVLRRAEHQACSNLVVVVGVRVERSARLPGRRTQLRVRENAREEREEHPLWVQ